MKNRRAAFCDSINEPTDVTVATTRALHICAHLQTIAHANNQHARVRLGQQPEQQHERQGIAYCNNNGLQLVCEAEP